MMIDEAFERVILELGYVRRGKMFGHTAFFVGRRMFACVYGDGVAVRVDAAVAARSVAEVREFSPRGRRMRNWVLLVYGDGRRIASDRDVFVRAAEAVRC